MKKFYFVLVICSLLLSLSAKANYVIVGRVIEANGKPIPSVLIYTEGKKVSIKSDTNGVFSIVSNEKIESLIFEKDSYNTIEINVLSTTRMIVRMYKGTNTKDRIYRYDPKHTAREGIAGVLAPEKESSTEPSKPSPKGEELRRATSKSESSIEVVREISAEDYGKVSSVSTDLSSTKMKEMSMTVKDDIKFNQPAVGSGKLTAGEINDYSKWNLWNDLTESEFNQYSKQWFIYPKNRYTVLIKNMKNNNPIFNAKVRLVASDKVIWSSMSDNTGKAELWFNPYEQENIRSNNLKIEVEYNNTIQEIHNPKQFSNGLNIISINSDCKPASEIDIAFLVDATGSMQDEIDYLKADLENIISSIQDSLQSYQINLGVTFYRDLGDDYLIKGTNLDRNINTSLEFLKKNNAGGGGDYPEAVHDGLNEVINYMNWSDNSVTKVIFLILDAPPHKEKSVIDSMQKLIKIASSKGIRIIPVTCSGIEKESEYLMRSLALLTNGTYTFLTNHSGIGNPHIEPSTDKYEVETFNQLIKRLIFQYSYMPECIADKNYTIDTVREEIMKGGSPSDTTEIIKMSIYPNPAIDYIYINVPSKVENVFISDISGKIIRKLNISNSSPIRVELNDLPTGIYFIACELEKDKWLKAKFIISR